MRNPFKPGDKKTLTITVMSADVAKLADELIHPVYSTFALTRDAEYSGRLFVLDMKEDGEEGIGTGITLKHLSPALIGQEVVFTATLRDVTKNEIITDFEAKVNHRLVAEGTQWQKIINKAKFDKLLELLE